MSTKTKALKRLRSLPRGYTYTEAASLLKSLGYKQSNKGRTSGSRVGFYRKSDESVILLHKPHPGDVMVPAAVRALRDALLERGEFNGLD